MRDLTAAVIAALGAGTQHPVLLFKLKTSTGDVRAWTGIGDLIFQSEIYAGVGDMVGVGPLQETEEPRANPLVLKLSGVPSTMLSIVLGTQYQGRQTSLWLGFLDDAGLISSPVLLFRGRADMTVIDEGPETSVITFTAESRLADLHRPRLRRYTHEDQQELFTGDLGLQFVTTIQNTEVVWGE
jgi:hypothetical protein